MAEGEVEATEREDWGHPEPEAQLSSQRTSRTPSR